MNFPSKFERREDRQRQKEIDEALRFLKLPWHSVWSKDKINHPGPRRAGKWARGCVYGCKQQAKRSKV